ncbi:MAG TPA: glycosyltransferase, partial [Anaerolineales bacterium]|nr:glycosyltransferase [Anaerolineales bacterium]
MSAPTQPTRTLVHFSADLWGHVCPVLRVLGPARAAGWAVIRGNEWQNGHLTAFPARVDGADLVLIQRDFPRHAGAYDQVIAAARARGKPVIYELDDLLIGLPPAHPDYSRYMDFRPEILKALVEADAVTCSTPAIQEYLLGFNPRVYVIPNYLNDRLWTLRAPQVPDSPPAGGPVTLGYLGSHSHGPDLEMVAPLLADLLDRYGEGLRLRLWGIAPPPPLAGRGTVEWLEVGLVDYAGFAEYFSRQECDLFIAPLLDNLFNRSKSWIKFLEYSALGIPGVYSRLPPYEQVVIHGENGYLAAGHDEWEACLVRLIEDASLRTHMGAAAQETLRKDWLLSDHAGSWSGQMEGIYETASAPSSSAIPRRIAETFAGWHREERSAAEALHGEIAAREETIRELQARLGEKDHLMQIYTGQLDAIRGSTGWKLLEALYAIRLALMPRESRRERGMHVSIHSLRILKNEGARSLGSKWAGMLRARDSAVLLGDALAKPPPP